MEFGRTASAINSPMSAMPTRLLWLFVRKRRPRSRLWGPRTRLQPMHSMPHLASDLIFLADGSSTLLRTQAASDQVEQ